MTRNSKERLLTPRPCAKCGQMMSQELLLAKHSARGAKISKSLRERISNGERVGRPPSVFWDAVILLRKKPMSYRAIAEELKCSTHSVGRICREAGLNFIDLPLPPFKNPRLMRKRNLDPKANDGNRPWTEFEEKKNE